MAHFLDALPYDLSDPAGLALRDVLSSCYFREPDIIRFVLAADVDPSTIAWGQPARSTWTDTLRNASLQGKTRDLVEAVVRGGDAAVAARIQELLSTQPVISAPDPVALGWKAAPLTAEQERQTAAEPTLLDVTFLERGTELARGVVRLRVTMPNGKRYNGTGFFIADDLVLTNHHVLFDLDHGGAQATHVEVWFGYERAFAGSVRPYVTVAADPASIRGSDSTEDWAVIRINRDAIPPGTVVIDIDRMGSVGVDDRVYIIQHPHGGPKQIGMVHNIVRFVDDAELQYLTDTEKGSSGAPVFDEQWNLVGLHHQGCEVDTGGGTEIRNKGRLMARVVAGLTHAGLR